MDTNSLIDIGSDSNVIAGNFTRAGFQHDRIRQMIKDSVAKGGKETNWHLVRDASKLELIERTDFDSRGKPHPVAEIIVDGMSHNFGRHSRVSQHLIEMPGEQLQEQLRSGAYFFIETDEGMELVDFKLDAAHHFIHTDTEINGLMKHIGVSPIERLHRRNKHLHGNTQLKTHYLGAPYSAEDLTVEILNKMIAGGEFQSVLRYIWSPFTKAINSTYELIRLICVNGMIGTTNFMNTKIPLMNMWEENLKIANKQIQARINTSATARFAAMAQQNVSVGTLNQLLSHIDKRIENKNASSEDRQLLNGLRNVVNPRLHLLGVYQEHVFDNGDVSAQLPGHLSKMDAWNIATEMSSHTGESDNSTTFALSRIANDIVFADRDYRIQKSIGTPFLSAEQAFFGRLAA